MKQLINLQLIVCLIILTSFTFVNGQIRTPAASPLGKIEQRVGLTDISITYSRPGVKGRTIFGDLLDYGAIWRTGANQSTRISFSDDVKLEGKDVPKGEYAIYTIPGKEMWTVMIYKDLSLGGNVADYKKENEQARFDIKPQELPFDVETLTFMINNIHDEEATIFMMWEKTIIPIKLEVEVDSKVMAAIDQTMAGPSSGDYYQAAMYYYNNGKDLDKALTWINKSLETRETYWMVSSKAQIQAKKGDKAGAMKTAEKALKLSEEAKDSAFIKSNTDLIAELKSKM